MEPQALIGEVLAPEPIGRAAVTVRDGRILAVARSPREGDLPRRRREVSGLICPGFVDLQITRGYNLPTAHEAALKLMETSYVVAHAFSAADLRHGPMAIIGRSFPVVAIVPPGKARTEMSSLVEDLIDRGAEVAVISDDDILADRTAASFLVPGSCSEELSPVLYAIPPQILSHDLSHLKRLDPDSPRGLSKVTETW